MKKPETRCDIIIPVWNQWPLTKACLEALGEKTRVPYRIIVIDNGSGEETRNGLIAFAADPKRNLQVIRNEENQGFIRAVNQGLRIATAPFLCLLNNDVVVTEGWLEKMIRFAEKHPDAGLVTCLQNDQPGRKKPADLEGFARSQVEEEGSYEEIDHGTGTCLLIKREVIEKIGYLDERFGMGYWEDNDFSRRAQKAGYRCYRLRDTYVWHSIGASFQKIAQWPKEEKRNQEIFFTRWGKPLRVIYPVSERIDLRRARFHQILQTIHALARQFCEIDFIIGKGPLDFRKEVLPYYHLGQHQNLRTHTIPIWRADETHRIRFSWNGIFHIGAFLKIRDLIRQREIQAIYLRHLNLADFLLRWKGYFKVPMVFEAHEVFHLTTERKEKRAKIRKLEERVYKRLDGVVAISHGLAEDLRAIFSIQAPLAIIPDGVNLDLFRMERRPIERGKIIYVGQMYSWKGVKVSIQAMPHLPGWQLHMVGGGEKEIEAYRQLAMKMGVADRVVFHGQVPPLEVCKHLADAQVAVLPLTRDTIGARYTSPLKLFEYMAAGVPIVASDLPSLREILQHEVNALLVEPENPQALADGIRRMSNPDLAERIRSKAEEDVLQYTWEKRAQRIIAFLRELKRKE